MKSVIFCLTVVIKSSIINLYNQVVMIVGMIMRKDGKRVKSPDAEYAVVPHIMVDRNDALNMAQFDIPMDPIQNYLNQKRKENINISHLSVVIAAYARMIGEFPFLNRFIVNRKIYARNELAVGMVVLKSGQMDNGTISKVNIDPADTIFEVNDKMNKYIDANRKESGENGTDKMAGALLKIPGLLRIGVSFFKWIDKHGLLPRSVIDISPFHASMTITNLASIRMGAIYHHIYNFGTTSLLIAMGLPHDVARPDKENGYRFEKCIPLGVVMDERICSGTYYAKAFRTFMKYLEDPSLLEQKPDPEKVIREVPYRKDK